MLSRDLDWKQNSWDQNNNFIMGSQHPIIGLTCYHITKLWLRSFFFFHVLSVISISLMNVCLEFLFTFCGFDFWLLCFECFLDTLNTGPLSDMCLQIYSFSLSLVFALVWKRIFLILCEQICSLMKFEFYALSRISLLNIK